MIKNINPIRPVISSYSFANSILISDGTSLVANGKKVALETPNSERVLNNILSVILKGAIKVYDSDLNLYHTIVDKTLSQANAGIETLSPRHFAVYKDSSLDIYVDGQKISHTESFWGKVLSPHYRLNFKENSFDNPKYFRCSDLCDTETFFNFTCGPDEEVIRQFHVSNEALLFPILGPNGHHMVFLSLPTGEVIKQIPLKYPSFNFDSKRNFLVSVWSTSETDGSAFYQIVDIARQTVEFGQSNGLKVGRGIKTPHHLERIYGDHFYFAENRHSYVGEEPNPARFGRMNIDTKTIDLYHEIEESPLSQISQIIKCDNKIYVQNTNNEILVYEAD